MKMTRSHWLTNCLKERIVDALTKSEELGNLRKVIDEKSSIVKTWEEIVDRDCKQIRLVLIAV